MTYDAERLPPPPRQVPTALRFQVLLGGPLAIIGWLFATPSRAVLVDNLPGHPRLDLDQGGFVGGSRGLLTLLLPAAFVLVNAVGVVWACL